MAGYEDYFVSGYVHDRGRTQEFLDAQLAANVAIYGSQQTSLIGTWEQMKKEGCTFFSLREAELTLLGMHRRPYFQRKGTCHPSGVMVRMADGTEKPIQCVVVGDIVLSHTGHARKVLDVGSRLYSGELSSIRVAGSNRYCPMTHDHPVANFSLRRSSSSDRHGDHRPKVVPGNLTWTPASEILRGLLALVPTPTDDNAYQVIDAAEFIGSESLAKPSGTPLITDSHVRQKRSSKRIARHIKFDECFARILGLYAGEGHCEFNEIGEPRRLTWTFCEDESRFVEEVAEWLKSHGAKPILIENKSQHVLRVRVNHKTIASLFHFLCPGKAVNKKLNQVVHKSPKSVRRAFLRGWMDSDGHFRVDHKEDGVRSLCIGVSSSAAMIDQINSLCASLGIASHTNVRRKASHQTVAARTCSIYGSQILEIYPEYEEKIQRSDCYKKRTPVQWWKNEFGLLRKVVDIAKTKVESIVVYSLEVEEDHSYVAEGIAVHNCVARGITRAAQASLDYAIAKLGKLYKPVTLTFAMMYTLARNEIGRGRCGWGDGAILADAAAAINRYGIGAVDLFKGMTEIQVENLACQFAAPNQRTPQKWIDAAKGHTAKIFSPETLSIMFDVIGAGYGTGYACQYVTAMPNASGLSRLGKYGPHCRCATGIYVDENGRDQLIGTESWGSFPARDPQLEDYEIPVIQMPSVTVRTAKGPRKLAPGDVGLDAKQFFEAIENGGEVWSIGAPNFEPDALADMNQPQYVG